MDPEVELSSFFSQLEQNADYFNEIIYFIFNFVKLLKYLIWMPS